MKRGDFLQRWGLASLKLNLGLVDGEFSPSDPDRSAAWELYVVSLTRITTQSLPVEHGDEQTPLESESRKKTGSPRTCGLLQTYSHSAWDKAMADLGAGLRELESAVVLRPLTLTVNVVRDKSTSTKLPV